MLNVLLFSCFFFAKFVVRIISSCGGGVQELEIETLRPRSTLTLLVHHHKTGPYSFEFQCLTIVYRIHTNPQLLQYPYRHPQL